MVFVAFGDFSLTYGVSDCRTWLIDLFIFYVLEYYVLMASCVEGQFCSLWPKLEPWGQELGGGGGWAASKWQHTLCGGPVVGIITAKSKFFGLEVLETMEPLVVLLPLRLLSYLGR